MRSHEDDPSTLAKDSCPSSSRIGVFSSLQACPKMDTRFLPSTNSVEAFRGFDLVQRVCSEPHRLDSWISIYLREEMAGSLGVDWYVSKQ